MLSIKGKNILKKKFLTSIQNTNICCYADDTQLFNSDEPASSSSHGMTPGYLWFSFWVQTPHCISGNKNTNTTDPDSDPGPQVCVMFQLLQLWVLNNWNHLREEEEEDGGEGRMWPTSSLGFLSSSCFVWGDSRVLVLDLMVCHHRLPTPPRWVCASSLTSCRTTGGRIQVGWGGQMSRWWMFGTLNPGPTVVQPMGVDVSGQKSLEVDLQQKYSVSWRSVTSYTQQLPWQPVVSTHKEQQ